MRYAGLVAAAIQTHHKTNQNQQLGCALHIVWRESDRTKCCKPKAYAMLTFPPFKVHSKFERDELKC